MQITIVPSQTMSSDTRRAYGVKRYRNGRWGGMYDYTAMHATQELARQTSLWAEREKHGAPTILIEYDDLEAENPGRRIIDAWSPDGIIPPTHCI